jgi:hypothetical protein
MIKNAIPQKRKKTRTRTPNSVVKDHAQSFPECLGQLFGNAPTLKSEDRKVYWDFMNEVIRCIKPEDMIEWLRVKDVVDLSWEILRFRKLKITLIEIEREETNAGIEWAREHPDEPFYDGDGLALRLRPPTEKEMERRKNRPPIDTETDSAGLLWRHIDQYERIESLLTSAELRRDRILREIEIHRAELARRLRQTTGEIIDARSEPAAIAAE